MKTKKGDFIEIEYIAKIKETNQIFDLTDENLAKEKKIHNPNYKYGPKIICLGENYVVKGLDNQLTDKELKKYTFEISPEEGFGKKSAKLMKLLPLSAFKKQEMKPFPGLQVNIDGMIGIIRTVSGGRVIVDFNHPLAGRTLIYEIKINRIVKDIKEKVNSILSLFVKEPEIEIKENNLKIKSKIPEQLHKILDEKIKKLIPEIKKIEFEKETPSKK